MPRLCFTRPAAGSAFPLNAGWDDQQARSN